MVALRLEGVTGPSPRVRWAVVRSLSTCSALRWRILVSRPLNPAGQCHRDALAFYGGEDVVVLAKPNSSFLCFVWWRRPSFHVASDVLHARVATACPPNCDASRSRWLPHQRLKWPLWCLCSPHQGLKWPLWCPCSPHQRPKWPLGCPLPIEKRPLPLFFLAALKRAEAAAIGRSLGSLFRALAAMLCW